MNCLKFAVVLALTSALTACGGVADYTSPDLILNIPAGTFATSGDLVVFKPYDKRDLLSKRAMSMLLDAEGGQERQTVAINVGQSTVVTLRGHMRSGAFWVVPPLGTSLLDKGCYALLKEPDGTVLGIAAEDGIITVYAADSDGTLRAKSPESARQQFGIDRSPKTPQQVEVTWKSGGSAAP